MRTHRLLLNILLLGATVFFSVQAYDNLEAIGRGNAGSNRIRPAEIPAVNVPAVVWRTSPESSYADIVEMNLFSQDRKPPVKEKAAEPETELKQALVAGGKIELFGVVRMPGYEAALISNPVRKTGSDKAFLWVKQGERIGGLTVSEIQSESVVLREGARRVRVMLYDKKTTERDEWVRSEGQPTVVATEPEKAAGKSAGTEFGGSASEPAGKVRRMVNPFEIPAKKP